MIELFKALSKKKLIKIIKKVYDDNITLTTEIQDFNDYLLKPTDKELKLQSDITEKNRVIKELRATIKRQNNKSALEMLRSLRLFTVGLDTNRDLIIKEDKDNGDWVHVDEFNSALNYISGLK